MKANELRIGNWVNVIKIAPVQITAGHIKSIAEGDTQYSPILLTPEMLGQFRFDQTRQFFELNDLILLKVEDVYYYYYNSGTGSRTQLKYLHQLQNLYFALTGEELQCDQQ